MGGGGDGALVALLVERFGERAGERGLLEGAAELAVCLGLVLVEALLLEQLLLDAVVERAEAGDLVGHLAEPRVRLSAR